MRVEKAHRGRGCSGAGRKKGHYREEKKERWRNKRRKAPGAGRRIGEESGRGMGGDRNENERAAGWEGGAPASASARRAPALAFSPVARTHFVTITGPSLGPNCFPQIVVL